jgi:hypothetical protein
MFIMMPSFEVTPALSAVQFAEHKVYAVLMLAKA